MKIIQAFSAQFKKKKERKKYIRKEGDKLKSATAHEGQGLLGPSQYTRPLGAEVHEQMSRSGGYSEVRSPVFKPSSKLDTHLSTYCRGVATAVSAVSMIRGPKAIGAPACVTVVPPTRLPYLKNCSEGILKQGPLTANYARDL
ncbi:hypothetical protein TNCV_2202961 [Trichonephila clavipes]|uniref:Uncharacterized protein n=1 Tax=Trichonephila clavipes TaxID=2585209 RepID=A0A8X6S8H6_TRICX|nr:hypothetical protein TNCV_2202961 [Trichonephila clavipes]